MIKKLIKKFEDLWPSLKNDTFYHVDFETDIVIKSTPGPKDGPKIKYFRRVKGKEIELFFTDDIVFNALNGQNFTTRKKYESS